MWPWRVLRLGNRCSSIARVPIPTISWKVSFTYKASVSAIVGLALTLLAYCLAIGTKGRLLKRLFQLLAVMGIALLTCYVVWFFVSEYPRISPDYASVGMASTVQDRIGGSVLLGCALLWFAMQASRTGEVHTIASTGQGTRLGRLPLACAALGCALFGLLVLGDMVRGLIDYLEPMSFSELYTSETRYFLIRPPEVWFCRRPSGNGPATLTATLA